LGSSGSMYPKNRKDTMSKGEKIDSSIALGFALAIFAPIIYWFSADVKWINFVFASISVFWAFQLYNDWKRN